MDLYLLDSHEHVHQKVVIHAENASANLVTVFD